MIPLADRDEINNEDTEVMVRAGDLAAALHGCTIADVAVLDLVRTASLPWYADVRVVVWREPSGAVRVQNITPVGD